MPERESRKLRVLDRVSLVTVVAGTYLIGVGIAYYGELLFIGILVAYLGAILQMEYLRLTSAPLAEKHAWYARHVWTNNQSFKSKWWRVITWYPAALAAGYFTLKTNHPVEQTKLLIACQGSLFVMLRAIVGIITRRLENWWWVYFALHFVLIAIVHYFIEA